TAVNRWWSPRRTSRRHRHFCGPQKPCATGWPDKPRAPLRIPHIPHSALRTPHSALDSGGGFVAAFTADHGFGFAEDDLASDLNADDIAAGHIEHHVEHESFQEAAQSPRAGAFLDGLGGQFLKSVGTELEFDAL